MSRAGQPGGVAVAGRVRLLNDTQLDALDDLGREYGDDVKVVGWTGTGIGGGPVIEYLGTYRFVNRQGRICPSLGPDRELPTAGNFG